MAQIEWRAHTALARERAAGEARAAAVERARTTDPRTLTTIAQLRAYVHDMAVAGGVRAP